MAESCNRYSDDPFQRVFSFDFQDPLLSENSAISPLLSAQQQLLYWLKGESNPYPYLDKVLTFQWKDYQIAIGLKYSKAIGGDFYEVFEAPKPTQLNLVIADISNNGVEAAINLGKAHHFWTIPENVKRDVLSTMFAYGKYFKDSFNLYESGSYESCSLCYLQINEERISFCNAGLAKPLLIEKNQVKEIDPNIKDFGPIGRWSHPPISDFPQLELEEGEILAVFTDGIYENKNREKKFTLSELKKLLMEKQEEELEQIVKDVFQEMEKQLSDDFM